MTPKDSLAYRVFAIPGLVLIRAFEAAVRRAAPDRVFHEPGDFPWLPRIENGWREMRAELDQLLADRRPIPNFEDLSEEQKRIVAPELWKSFVFRFYGEEVADNCARCPRTTALLRSIPGMTTAMFSILRPGSRLVPHRGPFKGVLRLHVGLSIPAGAPRCAIRVHDEVRGWEEGKSLIFDDTYEHTAWNDADEPRAVLFVDFLRDLPFPLGPLNRGMIRLIGVSPLTRNLIENVNRLNERVADAPGPG
jgi:aspartyl/asparaginyl beta-hydroxylase (cupin superfamily)